MFRTILAVFISLTFITPKFALAQDEPKFAVSRETIYSVSETGLTTVTENFTLTNLTADFFPQEYRFRLPKDGLTNLKAVDRLGAANVQLVTTGNLQEIKVTFHDEVLGAGKILRFMVSYDTPTIAKKQGRLWQIFIPPVPALPGETTAATRVIVPTTFGQQVSVKPIPQASELFWTKDDLKKSAIEVVYDPTSELLPYQAYDFNLLYQLYNSRLYPVSLTIALPGDSTYQKIYLSEISPKPEKIVIDNDGNWVASYLLGPTARLAVTVSGSAAVVFEPKPIAKTPELKNYLGPQKFWPTEDTQLKKTAQTLTTPAAVYNFVLSALDYQPNPKPTSRLGARAALQNPSAAGAPEFTDLFVTLARSAGFAARQVNGYYQGQLHLWPEYFDTAKNTWVMVDPALAKLNGAEDFFATFDFNHLAITREGLGQSLLLPTSATVKPVAKNLDAGELPQVTASFSIPQKITAGFATSGKIIVENHGSTLFPPEAITLASDTFSFESQVFLTSEIPPFGRQELAVRILPTPRLSQTDGIISLKFGSHRQDYQLSAVPLYKNIYLLILGALTILGLVSIITQIAWGLFFQKRQGRSDLRGKG